MQNSFADKTGANEKLFKVYTFIRGAIIAGLWMFRAYGLPNDYLAG